MGHLVRQHAIVHSKEKKNFKNGVLTCWDLFGHAT